MVGHRWCPRKLARALELYLPAPDRTSPSRTGRSSMVKQKSVCVIGAGVSGLVAAKTFGVRGHKVTILERGGDRGGVWEPARPYPDAQPQSPKDLYRYTDKPMPDSYPEWPKGPQVHAYLSDYAREHGLMQRLRLSTAVVNMTRRSSGLPGWALEIKNPDGKVTTEG